MLERLKLNLDILRCMPPPKPVPLYKRLFWRVAWYFARIGRAVLILLFAVVGEAYDTEDEDD